MDKAHGPFCGEHLSLKWTQPKNKWQMSEWGTNKAVSDMDLWLWASVAPLESPLARLESLMWDLSEALGGPVYSYGQVDYKWIFLTNPSTNHSGVEGLIREMLVSNMLNIGHWGMDLMCLCWPNTLKYLLFYFSILVPLIYSAVFVVIIIINSTLTLPFPVEK